MKNDSYRHQNINRTKCINERKFLLIINEWLKARREVQGQSIILEAIFYFENPGKGPWTPSPLDLKYLLINLFKEADKYKYCTKWLFLNSIKTLLLALIIRKHIKWILHQHITSLTNLNLTHFLFIRNSKNLYNNTTTRFFIRNRFIRNLY